MNLIRQISLAGGIAAAIFLLSSAATAQDLYVYPAQGQSDQQLADDRYACHLWAVRESDFDPSQFGEVAPPRTVRVPVPENKADGAAEKGAIAGAVVGAVIGAHNDEVGEGVVVGAVVGAITGAAIEEHGEHEAREIARAEAQRRAEEIGQTRAEGLLRRSDYRRALTACLQGRGYSVR